jgi:hypothetical protein
MRLAIQVQHRLGGINAKTQGSVLVAHSAYVQVVAIPLSVFVFGVNLNNCFSFSFNRS